jgi:hypothetical protein
MVVHMHHVLLQSRKNCYVDLRGTENLAFERKQGEELKR